MTNKTRIAVFVSGGGTNLQALIDAEKSGIIKSGKIELVISSSPNAYAITRAENANIPVVVVSKKECGSQELFEEKIKNALKEYNIELIDPRYYTGSIEEYINESGIKNVLFLFGIDTLASANISIR